MLLSRDGAQQAMSNDDARRCVWKMSTGQGAGRERDKEQAESVILSLNLHCARRIAVERGAKFSGAFE